MATKPVTSALWKRLTDAQARKIVPRVVSSGQGSHLTIGGKPYLNMCSSHYLGFAEEPRLKKAAQDAIDQYGLGTGYRTLSGTHALHVELEKRIAEFKGTEAAVCFTSAYSANASAVQTLLGKEDIVVSDQLNHASIIDAVRVAGVKNKFAYAHSDMGDLEAKLKQAAEIQKTPKKNGEQPLILVVTDGVFSMDGDLAPLDKIVDLCKKYDALSMVDDAHGEGVLGEGGRGVVNHFGLEGEVDIEIGSLSKAFSVMGGFIAAKQPLVDAYLMSARQRLFSIALTIPVRAAQSLPGRPAPPRSMLAPVLVLLLLVRETLAVALRLCVDTDWSSPTVLIWLYIDPAHAGHGGAAGGGDDAGRVGAQGGEALGQPRLPQQRIPGAWLRHRPVRDPDHPRHAWRRGSGKPLNRHHEDLQRWIASSESRPLYPRTVISR